MLWWKYFHVATFEPKHLLTILPFETGLLIKAPNTLRVIHLAPPKERNVLYDLNEPFCQ